MKFKIRKSSIISSIAILLTILLMVVIGGCAPKAAVKEPGKDVEDRIEPRLITDIRTAEYPESIMVLVKGNQPLTYTSVKQPFPPGIILYFPETALDNVTTHLMPDVDLISSIKATELAENGHTSRIEIELIKDISYEVTRDGTVLQISFKKEPESLSSTETKEAGEELSDKSVVKPAGEENPVATRLQSVNATSLEKGVKITVEADGSIKDYKSFIIDNPARIVFDLFNIQSAYKKEHMVSVGSEWVKNVRHFGYPDRLRLVLDTKQSYLSAFSANPVENGLVIYVGTKDTEADVPKKEEKETQVELKKPAWVNRIDFSSGDAGKSMIIIGTTRPVQYNIEKSSDSKLQLELFNTRLPAYRQRPLVTTRFESAVDRIIPVQTRAMKNTAQVSIEMREAVPYYVEQTDDLLLIHFEASSVSPKPLEEVGLPAWKKVFAKAASETEEPEAKEYVEAKAEVAVPESADISYTVEKKPEDIETDSTNLFDEAPKKYTGEKIALDFFETDIKNVIRILREISNENFAIDKDVKGKVSLTFEKPVPWDQVLDLILKMNQLGKVYEGNIIRIATLSTLKKAQDAKRDKLAAEKSAKDAKKALEPLITEYLSISYANAETEIKPHVELILTKERGVISVDERTNQIIITDVVEKIKKAKEIIANIDKVTPQVIIEARIVEADTTFSREIGTEWALGSGEQTSEVLDVGSGMTSENEESLNSLVGAGDEGSYGTNMAINLPLSASAGSIGFNFIKIAGTPFLLNAKLMALESDGILKIISAPKIVTLDNKTAVIKQGLQYPYNKLDSDGNVTTELIEIVLRLETTPHVTPDNRIAMKIKIEKTDLGTLINAQQSFTTKEAETELLVNNGDTVVIGGIIKTTEEKSESGIPLLSKMPVLGWLFKTKKDYDKKEELLIFITPKIVQLEQRVM